MLLYYITDRTQFGDDEPTRRVRLLEKIAEAAHAGVDYIQLREKDLSGRDLERLAKGAMDVIAQGSVPGTENRELKTGNRQLRTALLINSRVDIALACTADGVHLPANDVSPRTVREIYARSTNNAQPSISISVSCHKVYEVSRAAEQGADFALFAPVFGKLAQKNLPATPAAGLDTLRVACQQKIPVLALGGVTIENASNCVNAGAAGIAAIRLFQENNISEVVRQLRSR